MGPSWVRFRRSWPQLRDLGLFWGRSGAILGRLGAILALLRVVLGPSWGHLGSVLGPSWDTLAPQNKEFLIVYSISGLSADLGPSSVILGRSWAHLRRYFPIFRDLGPIPGPSWGYFRWPWCCSGSFGAILEPMYESRSPSRAGVTRFLGSASASTALTQCCGKGGRLQRRVGRGPYPSLRR